MKKGFIFRHRVVNPELGKPILDPKEARRERAGMRRPVCASCKFYLSQNGQDRCTHVDRKCELLDLGRLSETCPIDAWKGISL